MVNLATRLEDEPLFRRLGLALNHTEKLGPIGTVAYAGGKVQVEAGAIEIPYAGTMRLPEGEYRVASDWRSLWRFTVTGEKAGAPTVITAATGFSECWTLVEMLVAGKPLDAVIRAAGKRLAKGEIEISQDPGAISALTTAGALGRPHVFLPADAFPADSYVLQVTGDSMTGDGIHDGDLVVVDPGQTPGDGDIAVVTLDWDDRATGLHRTHCMVKRLRGGGTLFESSNPGTPPIPLPPGGRVRIDGGVLAALAADGEATIVTPFTGGAPYRIPRVRRS